MRTTAKNITLVGVYVALLIGGQLALSSLAGVEVVTVLLLCFAYRFGARKGVAVATAFSLVRCLIFGFYLPVIVVYLIYFNAFALFFAWLGKGGQAISMKKLPLVVFCAVLFTASFTLLDDIVTPLFYGFTWQASKAYFIASLYTLFPQMASTLITVTLFAKPLVKVLSFARTNE